MRRDGQTIDIHVSWQIMSNPPNRSSLLTLHVSLDPLHTTPETRGMPIWWSLRSRSFLWNASPWIYVNDVKFFPFKPKNTDGKSMLVAECKMQIHDSSRFWYSLCKKLLRSVWNLPLKFQSLLLRFYDVLRNLFGWYIHFHYLCRLKASPTPWKE